MVEPTVRKHTSRRGFLLLAASLSFLLTPLHPQSTAPPAIPEWQTAAGGKLSFEVASIRQSAPNAPYSGNVDLDGSDSLLRYNGGLVKTDGVLISYILFAYNVQDASQYPQLYAELPKWTQNERFIVEARPAGSPTKDQIRLMMQSLLAERFKLAIHTETRQLPMYALMLDKPGKPGPKLQPHPDDGLCTKIPDTSTPPVKSPAIPPSCQLIIFTDNPQLPHMRMNDFSLEQIAGGLETTGVVMGGLDHIPIVDQTGLTGKFDIDLNFARAPKAGRAPDPDAEPAEPGASFTEALKIQAGLKLVKQTGPVTVYVIDHIDPPSEN
jgi:uncharacterized protein (TIGR03435 family)